MARAAGAVVVGKTVTTEFAAFHPGKTANPHNPAHTPGGSSSGSAAAVADGMVPLGFGTQTAGSVIRPGAYCGVVGYKPSFGLIARAGIKPLADSLDTLGIFAANVADAAFFAGVLSERPALRRLLCRRRRRRASGSTARPMWDEAEPRDGGGARRGAGGPGARRRRGRGTGDRTPEHHGLTAAQDRVMGYEMGRCARA